MSSDDTKLKDNIKINKRLEKIKCGICGKELSKNNKSMHEKTANHMKFVEERRKILSEETKKELEELRKYKEDKELETLKRELEELRKYKEEKNKK